MSLVTSANHLLLIIYIVLFVVSLRVVTKEVNLAKGIVSGLLSITFIMMWDASWRYPILCLLFASIAIFNFYEFFNKRSLNANHS